MNKFDPAREARLAEALRANLRRRKAQGSTHAAPQTLHMPADAAACDSEAGEPGEPSPPARTSGA